MHGVALAVHKLFSQGLLKHPRDYVSRGIRRPLAIFVTFHFVCFTWLFFRNLSFETSKMMLNRIFTDFRADLFVPILHGYKYVLALMLFGFITHYIPNHWQEGIIAGLRRCNVVVCALFLIIVIYIVIQVKSSAIQPFIYFQF